MKTAKKKHLDHYSSRGMYEVEFDWIDLSKLSPWDCCFKHEKLRCPRTSSHEIESIIKQVYPNCRNLKLRIVKEKA